MSGWTSGRLMGANSVSGAPFSVLLLFVLLQACYLDQITGISAAILDHKASLRMQAMYWDAVENRRLGPRGHRGVLNPADFFSKTNECTPCFSHCYFGF